MAVAGPIWTCLPRRIGWSFNILLIQLGAHGSALAQEIFANASSFIKKPATLSALVAEIDKLDWYGVRPEDLGDLYKGLLEKKPDIDRTVQRSKSAAVFSKPFGKPSGMHIELAVHAHDRAGF